MHKLSLATALVLSLSTFACAELDPADEPELETSQNALITLHLEAEDSTGAGTVVADPTASAGELLRLNVPQSTATQTFSTSTPAASGRVRVRSSCVRAPWISVYVDGALLHTGQVSNNGQWQEPFYATNFGAGAHTLSIYYRSGLAGCLLDVDRVTFNLHDPPPPPVDVEAELATGAGIVVADATASAGAYRAMQSAITSASASFTTTAAGNATVRLRSTCPANWGQVFIDGQQRFLGQVPQAQWTELPIGGVNAGNHTVTFQYRSGAPGCELHYDRARITF